MEGVESVEAGSAAVCVRPPCCTRCESTKRSASFVLRVRERENERMPLSCSIAVASRGSGFMSLSLSAPASACSAGSAGSASAASVPSGADEREFVESISFSSGSSVLLPRSTSVFSYSCDPSEYY